MKKETIFAIMLGIAFGVIVSFFMISKTKDNQLGKSKPLTNEKKIIIPTGKIDIQTQTFKILEPQDKQIFNSNTISIKGEAEKDSLLIIQSPIKDLVYKVPTEKFVVEMPLALGENIINLTLYPKNTQGRIQQKDLRIYYL